MVVASACGAGAGATPVVTPVPTLQAFKIVHGGNSELIPAGRYVMTGEQAFFPGLELTVPDGWEAAESDWGELKLTPVGQPSSALLMWRDLLPTVTNNQEGKVGQAVHGADSTADAMSAWLQEQPDVQIVDGPTQKTIGDNIDGVELTVTTSPTAAYGDPDCPPNPRCVALFADVLYWPSGEFYGIGGDETSRVFMSTREFPEGEHTFYVTLDAIDEQHLADFAEAAQPIIDSLRLPEHYTKN